MATKRDVKKYYFERIAFCLHHPQEYYFEFILNFHISFIILVVRMKNYIKMGMCIIEYKIILNAEYILILIQKLC